MINATIDSVPTLDLLREAAALLLKPRKAMKLIELSLEQRVRDTFRDEIDPWGVPWPPHSPVTLAERERKGQSSLQMLRDSGALYSSIIWNADDVSVRAVAGAGLEYAEVQQFGNDGNKAWGRGSAPIPQRAFFPLRSEDLIDLPDSWLQDIQNAFDEAFGEVTQ